MKQSLVQRVHETSKKAVLIGAISFFGSFSPLFIYETFNEPFQMEVLRDAEVKISLLQEKAKEDKQKTIQKINSLRQLQKEIENNPQIREYNKTRNFLIYEIFSHFGLASLGIAYLGLLGYSKTDSRLN